MRLNPDTRAKRLWTAVAVIGVAMAVLSGATLFASLNGQPRQIFTLQSAPLPDLPAGVDVAGWATIDRDSIHLGQLASLSLRVVYREGAVEPDLDTLRRSVGSGRFTNIVSREARRLLSPGVAEVTIVHQLQGVTVQPHQTYQIDPIVLFYRSTGANAGELQKLHIATPLLHVSGYYPPDITGLSPRPVRGKIDDPQRLRQGIVIAGGSILALIALGLAWRFGRMRRRDELSDAERLWLEFNAAMPVGPTPRAALLFYETVFTRLRQACTRAAAEAFWAGEDPDDPFWRTTSEQARSILRANYRPAGASAVDVDPMSALLTGTFAIVVAEDRMRREQVPSWWRRLAQQPLPSAAAGLCTALALVLLVLGAVPNAWLSPALKRYNAALNLAQSPSTRLPAANDLFDLGQREGAGDLKASALYNAGTLLAAIDPLSDQLAAAPLGIVEQFKDAASLDAVVKSQTTLAMAVKRLRDAAMAVPQDEDIGRNLELVGKRHRIVVAALIELIKMQEERVVEMQDLRTMLDALNMVLHEDARDNERAQKPEYYIGEKF